MGKGIMCCNAERLDILVWKGVPFLQYRSKWHGHILILTGLSDSLRVVCLLFPCCRGGWMTFLFIKPVLEVWGAAKTLCHRTHISVKIVGIFFRDLCFFHKVCKRNVKVSATILCYAMEFGKCFSMKTVSVCISVSKAASLRSLFMWLMVIQVKTPQCSFLQRSWWLLVFVSVCSTTSEESSLSLLVNITLKTRLHCRVEGARDM